VVHENGDDGNSDNGDVNNDDRGSDYNLEANLL